MIWDTEQPLVPGSRDPYYISGTGAGFVFCFKGNTTVTSGHSDQDKELFQVSSDRTTLAIPEYVVSGAYGPLEKI